MIIQCVDGQITIEGKTERCGKYIISSFEREGKTLIKVYNTNAKKAFKALIHYYSFPTGERRDTWISNFKSNVAGREQEKTEYKNRRNKERESFINTMKAGDILTDSWGYEQTNVEFYKIIEVKGSLIFIRELTQKMVEGSGYSNSMSDMRIAGDAFVEDAPILKKQVRSRYVKINGSIGLSKWDGRPKYCSRYA